ncbi:MAG: TonB-dependent receptor [Verrucomicrobia bacterium]|nr:TonB-dependent receptor [Verrucomicrobiota bacterium]
MHSTARLAVLAIAGCVLTSTALAQAARPAPAATKPEDTVLLSEFTVKESSAVGYVASESITGTRVATQIKDLPFSVSVITSEFMQDFDLFDLAGDLAYTANLNGVDTQGNANLRGYGATFQLRNGFYRLGLSDRANTDRIEVIKGPNAAIYGSTSPAGLVNFVSKKPRFDTWSERLSLTTGSLDLFRGELSVNTPLGSLGGVKFAQLFTAEATNVGSETDFAFNRNRLLSESITAKFRDGSTLNFEVEWSKRRATPATSAVPFEYNATTRVYSSIVRRDLAHFSQGGPDSVANRELTSAYLTFDKRFNRVWSTHAGAYAYGRHAFNFNNGSNDQFDPRTGRFGRGNVIVDPLNEDGGGVQIDTLADYAAFGGNVQNKTLLTLDWSQNWRYREQRSPNTRVWTITGVTLTNPDYSLPPRWAFNVITRRDKTRWDVKGFLLRQQSAFLSGRLLAFASLRRDIVTYNFTFGDQFNRAGGALATRGLVQHYTDTAWSPNVGLNFKATSNISLYASRSRSFSPQGQVARLGEPHLDNETSAGWDYGVKAAYLDNTLVFTLGGFYIDRNGVKTTQRDPVTGLNETVSAGKQLSRGVEFEGSWRASESLTLTASYGHVNARIRYNGNAVTDIGRRPASVPVEQGSLAWKYSVLRGALKGLAWNGGVTSSGDAYPNSTATDARRNVAAPGYFLVNTGLAYTWSAGERRLRQTVRVSAKNLLNRDYLDQRGNLGAERGVFLAYTVAR